MAIPLVNVPILLIDRVYESFKKDVSNRSLRDGTVYQASFPVEEHRIFEWVIDGITGGIPFFYWNNRGDTFEAVGILPLMTISGKNVAELQRAFKNHQREIRLESASIRYFGGMQFNGLHHARAAWKKWPAYFFMIPHLEIFKQNAQYFININYTRQSLDDLDRLISTLRKLPVGSRDAMTRFIYQRTDVPGKEEWSRLIHQALKEFSPNDMVKVVLARESQYRFDSPLPIARIVEELQFHNSKSTYHFAFSPDGEEYFVGLTPERLYIREKNLLKSEAIAGTRRRGESDIEDEQLEHDLLCSAKDRFEHKLVMDSIDNQFYFLCDEVKRQPDVSVLKLDHLQHLYCAFKGQLKPNITDPMIISALHPTPAVGGSPRDKAMAFLSHNEPFDRGWYAAPIGWFSKDFAEFVVGIRSSLIKKREMFVYAGAGIVHGSDPDKEWEEIEDKIHVFKQLIQKL